MEGFADVPTRNVNLTNELDHFVQSKVASGRYENASEVVRAALRRLSARNNDTRRSCGACGPRSMKATAVELRGQGLRTCAEEAQLTAAALARVARLRFHGAPRLICTILVFIPFEVGAKCRRPLYFRVRGIVAKYHR